MYVTCSWRSYKPKTTAQQEQSDRTSHPPTSLCCLHSWPPLPPGVHKFLKNLETTSKLQAPEGSQEASSIKGDQQIRSDLWPPSVIWQFVFDACDLTSIAAYEGEHLKFYARNISRPMYKIQSPGMWSPLITTMNNTVDNLINHEQIPLHAGIQPRQK